MDPVVEANRQAWSLLSKDHYEFFKKGLLEDSYQLTGIILKELGDIKGKKVIHLQCNTGADSIKLAQMGAEVTGVDLVPENIFYARKLSEDVGIENIRFIESDIMELADKHHEKYDMVFTSEGAIGWLPDLEKWGQTIRGLLKDDGCFYVFDAHPFYLTMDEAKFNHHILDIKYPYFKKDPDLDTTIGGYASEGKKADNFFFMYTVGDIINALSKAGLHIEYFHEFDSMSCDVDWMMGIQAKEFYGGKFPVLFSVKASVYPTRQ